MNPTDLIDGLSKSVAQYPLAALLVAVAGGALSTSVCPCTLPTGVGLIAYIGGSGAVVVGRARSAPGGAKLGLAFFVGLVVALTALGAAAAAAGRLLTRYDAAFSVTAGAAQHRRKRCRREHHCPGRGDPT